jgi:excisionase family DNA binding protein
VPFHPVPTPADPDEAFSAGGPVLTVDEVAKTLRVNAKTVYALVKRGQLRAFRVGRALRCRQAEVARFIKASEAEANLQPAQAPTE